MSMTEKVSLQRSATKSAVTMPSILDTTMARRWQPRAPRLLLFFVVLTILLYWSQQTEGIKAVRQSEPRAQSAINVRLIPHGLSTTSYETRAEQGVKAASIPAVSQLDMGTPLSSLISLTGRSAAKRLYHILMPISAVSMTHVSQLLSGLLVSAVAHAEAANEPLPDVDVCMHQGASPVSEVSSPVLQWCLRSPLQLGFPSPYEADCVYRHRYVFTLPHYRRLASSSPSPPPFAERIPRAVWRGTCTGNAVAWRADNLEHVPRAKLALLSRKHPSLLDAVLFPCSRCAPLLRQKPELFGEVREAITDAQYARYKYIIDLDGDGCSGRLSKLFESGSVVLKPWQAGTPFFERAIRPWVHYVPIKSDLSDLLSNIRWLQSNEANASRIAANGAAFARTQLSTESIDSYVQALLRGIARLHPYLHSDDTHEDTLIYRSGSGRPYAATNLTDHKGRPLDVICPATAAPEHMLPVSSATELAQLYFEAAREGKSPRMKLSRGGQPRSQGLNRQSSPGTTHRLPAL